MTPDLLTPEDVARISGLSIYTVRAAIRDGELVASKLRGRWRVHPDDLAAWIDAGKVRPGLLIIDRGSPSPAPRPTPPPAGSARDVVRARRRAA